MLDSDYENKSKNLINEIEVTNKFVYITNKF